MKSINMIAHEGVVESVQLSDYDGSLQGISVLRKKLISEYSSNGAVADAERDRSADRSPDGAEEGEGASVRMKEEPEGPRGANNIREFVGCSALLFCVNPHQCDVDVFSAIRDCGLVFDGGVVVDKVRD